MCYKIEVQRKNEEKLQRKFDEENISLFIQKYFINIESKAGAINYWVAIRDLLLWLMEKKIINKSVLSDIEADDFYDVESEDVTMYLRYKEQSGMSPTTLETRRIFLVAFGNIFREVISVLLNRMSLKQFLIRVFLLIIILLRSCHLMNRLSKWKRRLLIRKMISCVLET